jgi:hypothetical protein
MRPHTQKLSMVLLTGMLLGLAPGTSPAMAQEPPPAPPPHESFRPDLNRQRDFRRGGRRSVEAWLERLQATNPQKFERLMQIRENTPFAFGPALKESMQHERILTHTREIPQLHSFLTGLPPEEQKDVLNRMGQLAHRPHREQGPPGRGPKPDSSEQAIRELVMSYHQASGEEREAIGQSLRQAIEVEFDRREAQRLERLQHMKSKLEKLQSEMADHKNQKDKIIENRFQELTSPDIFNP